MTKRVEIVLDLSDCADISLAQFNAVKETVKQLNPGFQIVEAFQTPNEKSPDAWKTVITLEKTDRTI